MQYELFSQESSSLKTWKESSAQSSREMDGKTQPERLFCCMSSENWKESVTAVRGEYSQRLKSAHPTNANESLSWPTVKARDWKDTLGCKLDAVNPDGTHRNRRDRLVGAIAAELFGPPDQAKPNKSGKSQEASGLWATPRADKTSAENLETWAKRNKEGKVQQQPLPTQVQNWPTPTVMSHPRSEETMEKCLKFRKSKGKNTVPLYLEEKVRNVSSGKLNPSWVEQLMGLPVGWTQLPTEWIG